MLVLSIKWFLRTWPVLVPGLLCAAHIAVSAICSIDISDTNKIISLVLQIVGGLLILYSIDSNIGVVNNNSLFTLFTSWLKSFPLIKRSYTLHADSVSIKTTVHAAKIRLGGPGRTTEERIEYLQKQIKWLKDDLNEEVKRLKGLVAGVEQRTNNEIANIRTAIGSVDQKITAISVGGIGWQVFGVLLMIHGAVASYYA